MRSSAGIAFLLLLVLPNIATAAFIPVTWNICGLELDNGARVTGSFVFDADLAPSSPPYRDINIQSGINYRHVTSTSPGSDTFLLALADPEPVSGASLVNKPNIAMSFATSLTNAGGTVQILTSDSVGFAGLGTCVNALCLQSAAGPRFAKNNPFVSTSACPTDDEEEDEGCDGPTGFFSFFSWLFCIVFDFLGSFFAS